MTLLRIRVTMLDANKAAALLFHLEDVATSRHTKGTVEDRTIIADVDERDVPAVKQLLIHYRNWIASFQ